ncbi:hypothetical protein [uncultured Winogradskyella sp.]|uniref:hypothetical protein n=1 Tax=uncultured Winogradskyella sp. TaxID=395353 RepID=UPI0026047365|nr:hypothetical protein [uncultured Winogradskyella sp.]
MNTITRVVVLAIIALMLNNANAQKKEADSTITRVQQRIAFIEMKKELIESEERRLLKEEIIAINKRLDVKEITAEEAEKLKKEAAKRRAQNIEDRLAIQDIELALLKRNGLPQREKDTIDVGFIRVIGPNIKARNTKYDRRTTTDFVFGIGFNNALIEGQSINDSPYKLGGSGFVELGYAWKTRIFKNTNFWRLKYGLSVQWNKLDIKNNQFFVNNNGEVSLQEFPLDLDKAKFRTTNLVFPVHVEFGPSKKIEKDNYFRYSTRDKLKIGLGGYGGLNIGSIQKLKYKENGDREKEKQKGDFEVSDLVYGLSGYLAWGGTALYLKYDLNPLFNNQQVSQNNISVGVRFDMD